MVAFRVPLVDIIAWQTAVLHSLGRDWPCVQIYLEEADDAKCQVCRVREKLRVGPTRNFTISDD